MQTPNTPAQSAPLQALLRLWNIARQDHGGAIVVAKFLLGLYDGPRFPFDLTDLRLLEDAVLWDVFLVLAMDANPQAEVHELLNRMLARRDIGNRFELIACDLRLKGRCPKEEEIALRAKVTRYEEVAA